MPKLWDMRGALHISKFPRKNENSVAFYGSATVEGKEYELRAWIKKPNKPGEQEWISIMFEPKGAATAPREEEEPFEQLAPRRPGRTVSAPDNVDMAAEYAQHERDEPPF